MFSRLPSPERVVDQSQFLPSLSTIRRDEEQSQSEASSTTFTSVAGSDGDALSISDQGEAIFQDLSMVQAQGGLEPDDLSCSMDTSPIPLFQPGPVAAPTVPPARHQVRIAPGGLPSKSQRSPLTGRRLSGQLRERITPRLAA